MRKPILASVILVLVVGMVLLCKIQSQSSSLSFDEISTEVDNIVKITYRDGGTGLLYETQDKIEISHFTQAMRATKYRKTKPNPWTGSGNTLLFDTNNKKIMGLSFGPNHNISINGVYYQMTNDIDGRRKTFYDEFLIERNVIKGK